MSGELDSTETSTPEIARASGDRRINANTYQTREKRTIGVNNQSEQWHLVKGTSESTIITDRGPVRVNYSVYFEPLSKRWLKVIPTQARGEDRETLERNLRAGVLIAKRSLELAGFPDLAEQTILMEDIQMPNGQTTIGFISPHIGPSIEQITFEQTGLRMPKPETMQAHPELRNSIGTYYEGAMDLALKLYLDHGYWTGDANPGNILLARNSREEERVVLIDFSNGTPLRDHLLKEEVPREVNSPSARERHREKLRRFLLISVDHLHLSFRQQCGRLGIPFTYDISEGNQELHAYIERIVERELPSLTEETDSEETTTS